MREDADEPAESSASLPAGPTADIRPAGRRGVRPALWPASRTRAAFWALGLIPAARHPDGSLWFSPAQVPAVARFQRLHATLPLNYAALGLVCDLLDRITDLETALRVRGRTEPVRRRTTQQPDANRPERSQ